jgi:hypothetical protein
MSTSLYDINVLEKNELDVKLRVIVTYQDMNDAGDDEDFFLQILWDEADTRFGGGGPLGDAISVDQILDEEFRWEHAGEYIAGVERLREHGVPADENPAYDAEPWDYEQLTWAEFRVTVTDPRWIAHLTPGMSWDTTSYPG